MCSLVESAVNVFCIENNNIIVINSPIEQNLQSSQCWQVRTGGIEWIAWSWAVLWKGMKITDIDLVFFRMYYQFIKIDNNSFDDKNFISYW